MNSRNVLRAMIGLATVTLLLVGCGPQQTAPAATSVAEAPAATPTPVSPTATPTPGFKDPSQCPDSSAGVSVPERLPNVQWSTMDSPSNAGINAVEVLSATDVWAVGDEGSILHYDGAAWTAVSSPTTYELKGLSMLSADEGWAVGHSISPPSYPNIILHYANQRWSTVNEPEVRYGFLKDVDFVASDKGWAVGDGILHYDGNNWIPFSMEELDIPGDLLNSVDMLSADEGWAVGLGGRILHYQGGTWQRVDSPVETSLLDVDMRSTEEGWIVGENGTILHFDGSAWSETDTPTTVDLFAVAVDDEGEAWAVGRGSTLLRFDGQTWVKMEVPGKGNLLDVNISDDGAAWAVGVPGRILRRELLDTDVPPPSPPVLKGVDNSDGDGSFSVSWESVPGNVKYILQEADQSMCPVTIYFGPDTLKEVSWKDIGTYYYRVSALGVSGQSEWSEIKSVKVTVPPPPCSVDCSAGVVITCESGQASYESFCYQTVDETKGLLDICQITVTYKESGNVYEVITKSYMAKTAEGKIQKCTEVTVTGGVFGDEPQHCQNY